MNGNGFIIAAILCAAFSGPSWAWMLLLSLGAIGLLAELGS